MVAQPPLAPGLPLLGSVLKMVGDVSEFLLTNYHALGPVFRIRFLGQEWTVLAGIKANLLLIQDGERYFANQPIYHRQAEEMNTPHFPIASDGATHRHYRKAIKTAFSREVIGQHIPRMVRVIEDAARGWQAGQVIPVRKTLQRLMIDVTGAALANQPAGDHFEDLRYFGITFIGASSAGWPPLLLRRRRYKQAKARTFAFVKRAIHSHRVHPATSAPDSIDMLLRAVDENGQPLSPDDLIAFTEMIYGNSVRSTTTVCAYALYALLKHPDLLEKVVAEVDSAFTYGMPDMASFRQMHWLHAVLLETMRYYPIAVMLPRAVIQDFEFGGHTIKAGQRVFIATTLTHFLPEFFPDPYTFDPERFLEPRHEQRQVGALAPMGLGAHACLGAAAADMVIMTALATLLHTVRFQLDPPDYVLKKTLDPTPVPEDRFAVRVERR